MGRNLPMTPGWRPLFISCLVLPLILRAQAPQSPPVTPAAPPKCRALIVHGLADTLYADDQGVVNAQFGLSLPDEDAACTEQAKLRHPAVTDLTAGGGYPVGAETSIAEVPPGKVVLANKNDRADYTLKITKIWDTGLFTAKLLNQGKVLHTFSLVRSRAPFGISLDPNTAIRSFAGVVQVPVKNPDPSMYLVKWRLKTGDMECNPFAAEVEVRGLSNDTLTCRLPLSSWEWFRAGFLKADTRNAVLTLDSALKPGMAAHPLPPQPRRELPVSLSVAFYEETTQEAVNMLWLLIVLLAGGVLSLLFGAGISNTMRRVKIRQRLAEVDGRIRRLPGRMDPELGVAMKVESRRIRELCTSEWWFSPDAGDSLTQSETALARLEAKGAIVAALTPALNVIHSPRGGGLPPSRIMVVEAKCQQIIQLLRRSGASDGDMTQATGLVNDCYVAVDKSSLKDDTLSQDIITREGVLKARLWNTGVEPPAIQSLFLPAYTLWRAPFDGVLAATSDPLDPMEYPIRDLRAVRLLLLVDFTSLSTGAGPTLQDVIIALQGNEWNGIRRARTLVAETLDGKTVQDLDEALKDAKVEIVLSHDTPDAFDSVTLCLCFLDTGLNGAAVREKFRPEWKFGHDRLAPRGSTQSRTYSAQGWEVRHFFPRAAKAVEYEVVVSILGFSVECDGRTRQPYSFTKKFTVPGRSGAPGRRFWLELARTTSLMVIGAVVMQKSAQSLLAGTSIWTVALGVLGAGFTIDTLKGGIDAIRSKF
jgi:hypothetical protein